MMTITAIWGITIEMVVKYCVVETQDKDSVAFQRARLLKRRCQHQL